MRMAWKRMDSYLKALIILELCVVLVIGSIAWFSQPSKVKAASQFANVVCDQWTPISLAADTKLVTAGTNMFVYICSIGVVAGTADNFSVVEGTGAACVTGTAAVIGGSTAATGMLMAANGVFTNGSGTGAIARTAVAGDDVCILRSSAGPLSGNISWTKQPF